MTIGDMIKEYRKRMNLSQREFAAKCGLSNVTISLYEKGINPHTGKPYKIEFETYYKLADVMGISVDEMFEQLGDDALVELIPSNIVPIRKFINDRKMKKVKVIGKVAAGNRITAYEDDMGEVIAPANVDYALVVKGDSMEPKFMNGDIIYVRKQEDLDYNSQIVVVEIDGESSVKYVYRFNEGILLVSENNAKYPAEPVYYKDHDEVKIVGKVCGFTRMF